MLSSIPNSVCHVVVLKLFTGISREPSRDAREMPVSVRVSCALKWQNGDGLRELGLLPAASAGAPELAGGVVLSSLGLLCQAAAELRSTVTSREPSPGLSETL